MSFSRVRGSLVAGVVGDCFGRLFEGSSYVSMKDVLIEVNRTERTWTDIQKKRAEGKTGRAIRQAEYTDDTAMARSIAASLVEEKSVNIEDIAARFAESYSKQPNRGYGGNVVTVLEALSGPDLKDIYKPARDQFNGTGSYGNGGAMRISPLGLFFHKQSLDELKEKTVDITRLTHSHRHAIVGALLQSFAVHLALSLDNGKRLDAAAFLSHLLLRLKPVEEEVYLNHRNLAAPVACDDDSEKTEKLPYCDKLELMKEFLTRDVSPEEVNDKLGTDISALRSVPTAVYCFLRGTKKNIPGLEGRSEVEHTILYAISLGGDTDTIATMAGAIAGAFFGMDQIPQSWQDSCEGVEDAIRYADGMVELFKATGRA